MLEYEEVTQFCAFSGHGSWWKSEKSHLNTALPAANFRKLGLFLLVEEVDWQTALRTAKFL